MEHDERASTVSPGGYFKFQKLFSVRGGLKCQILLSPNSLSGSSSFETALLLASGPQLSSFSEGEAVAQMALRSLRFHMSCKWTRRLLEELIMTQKKCITEWKQYAENTMFPNAQSMEDSIHQGGVIGKLSKCAATHFGLAIGLLADYCDKNLSFQPIPLHKRTILTGP